MHLQLKRSPSSEDVASALRQLATEPEAECELTLPASFSCNLPFDYATYLQLVLTWGARPGLKVLRVHGTGADAALGQLKSDHIQVAAVLAQRIVDLARLDVTELALVEVRRRLEKKRAIQPRAAGVSAPQNQSIVEVSRFAELSRSPDLTAPSDQGYGEVSQEARSLYGWVWPGSALDTLLPNARMGEVLVRGSSGHSHIELKRWPRDHPYLATPGAKVPYRTLAERLVTIRATARNRTRESSARPHRLEDDFGAILFELAQNAHTHGSVDAQNQSLENQVRVMATSTRRFDRADCQALEVANRPLARWMNRQLDSQSVSSSEMAVIDIVDNGIGLAQRAATLLGEYSELDPAQEFDYLQMALSKSTRQRSHRQSAEGLARVQLLMTNLGGFVSIKSGRIDLLRDFVEHPYDVSKTDLFLNWVPLTHKDADTERRGTVVTIVIPTR